MFWIKEQILSNCFALCDISEMKWKENYIVTALNNTKRVFKNIKNRDIIYKIKEN